jgi:hypothetical protein
MFALPVVQHLLNRLQKLNPLSPEFIGGARKTKPQTQEN